MYWSEQVSAGSSAVSLGHAYGLFMVRLCFSMTASRNECKKQRWNQVLIFSRVNFCSYFLLSPSVSFLFFILIFFWVSAYHIRYYL